MLAPRRADRAAEDRFADPSAAPTVPLCFHTGSVHRLQPQHSRSLCVLGVMLTRVVIRYSKNRKR